MSKGSSLHAVPLPVPQSFVSDDAVALGLSSEQQVKFVWLSMICGSLWALHLLLASRGMAHDDAIHHFLISREAWYRPLLLLDHWGRPVVTFLYLVPAHFGLVYARLAALLFGAVTVLLTFMLARRLRVEYAFLVPALLWFQPWFLTWTINPCMTEIPFALVLVLAAYLFVSNRIVLASAIIGLFPLVRMEALALTTLWVVVCAWRREWLGMVIAAFPVVAYGALYHVIFGSLPGGMFPLNPIEVVTRPHHAPPSWRISRWLIYPKLIVFGAGFPLTALALYGLPRLLASPARLAVSAWYGAWAFLHVSLLRIGIEGWAEDRYVLPLAPFISIAGAVGLRTLASQIRTWLPPGPKETTESARPRILILAFAVVAAVASGLFVSPIPRESAEDAARAAVAWLREERLIDVPIVSSPSNVWFRYILPDHLVPHHVEATRAGPPLSNLPRGSIAVWDSEESNDWGLPWEALSSDHGWRLLKTFEVGKVRMVIFEKQSP